MASQIHFKLKRDRDFDSIAFSGMSMRLLDLKIAIAEKKFGNSRGDFDLVVQQAQTKEAIMNDNTMVPKNTQVIVIMVPANGKGLLRNISRNKVSQISQNIPSNQNDYNGNDEISKNLSTINRLANTQPTYERIGGKGKGASGYNNNHSNGRGTGRGGGGGGSGVGSGGSGIIDGEERKALKGVPMKFQRFNEEGVASMVANDEKFQHNRDKAIDTHNTLALSSQRSLYGDALSADYKCALCQEAMIDTVVLQWASKNTCDHCIRNLMRENQGICPFTNVKVRGWQDQLIPNKKLRKEINDFAIKFANGQIELQMKAKKLQEEEEEKAKEALEGGGHLSRDTLGGKESMQTSSITQRRNESGVDAELDLSVDLSGGSSGGGLFDSSNPFSLSGGGLYDDFVHDEVEPENNDDQEEDDEADFSGEKVNPPNSRQESPSLSSRNYDNQLPSFTNETSQSQLPSLEHVVPPFVPPGPRPPSGPPPPHVIEQRERERMAREKNGFNEQTNTIDSVDYTPHNRHPFTGSSVDYPVTNYPPQTNYGTHTQMNQNASNGHYGSNEGRLKRPRGGGGVEVCRDFTKGRCHRGKACIYSHDIPTTNQAPSPMFQETSSLPDNNKRSQSIDTYHDRYPIKELKAPSRDHSYNDHTYSNNMNSHYSNNQQHNRQEGTGGKGYDNHLDHQYRNSDSNRHEYQYQRQDGRGDVAGKYSQKPN